MYRISYVIALFMVIAMILTGCSTQNSLISVIPAEKSSVTTPPDKSVYALININTNTIHMDCDCYHVVNVDNNRKRYTLKSDTEELIGAGYKYCKTCCQEKEEL